MPLIRCPKCAQEYDVPGVVAVRLPNSIATCSCGEWLSGSKAALLARTIDIEQVRRIDMSEYRVRHVEPAAEANPDATDASLRVAARCEHDSIDTIFTIEEHPLWIGRRGCHVEPAGEGIATRHCSIALEAGNLVLRDGGSGSLTLLDDEPVKRTVITAGPHVLRVGTALVRLERSAARGLPVEPIEALDAMLLEIDEPLPVIDELPPLEYAPPLEFAAPLQNDSAAPVSGPDGRTILVCVKGPLAGQEFEVPQTGLIVGREGHVRVPDEFLSRRHFEILLDAGSVRLRDLKSRNGTFVNAQAAAELVIRPGDEIDAGVNRFRIELR